MLARSVTHTQAHQLGQALAASRWVLTHLSSLAARAEDSHQKYYLRRNPALMREFSAYSGPVSTDG